MQLFWLYTLDGANKQRSTDYYWMVERRVKRVTQNQTSAAVTSHKPHNAAEIFAYIGVVKQTTMRMHLRDHVDASGNSLTNRITQNDLQKKLNNFPKNHSTKCLLG